MIASANLSCCVSFIQLLSLFLQIDSKHWILSRCCLWLFKLKIWIRYAWCLRFCWYVCRDRMQAINRFLTRRSYGCRFMGVAIGSVILSRWVILGYIGGCHVDLVAGTSGCDAH